MLQDSEISLAPVHLDHIEDLERCHVGTSGYNRHRLMSQID